MSYTCSNYQQGLLHFAHLLTAVDGVVNEHEHNALERMRKEEDISEETYADFLSLVTGKPEGIIFNDGLKLLHGCTEEERTAVVVHLLRLSEADDCIHKKEVRLLFYSLQVMNVDFENVELTARMANAGIR